MTHNPNDRASDRQLEQELETIRSVWQTQERAEPPDLLDQTVLNTARRALQDRRKQRPLRWLGAFATLGVVVLALAIVVQQDQQGPVPPLPKTDGLWLDQQVSPPAKAASDAVVAEPEGGRAELRMQRQAAPTVAREQAPALRDEQLPPKREEALEEDADIPDPEAWIERMLRAKKAGHLDELRAELTAFRRAYPDYPLPAELRE